MKRLTMLSPENARAKLDEILANGCKKLVIIAEGGETSTEFYAYGEVALRDLAYFSHMLTDAVIHAHPVEETVPVKH